ncbi:hypothetical protein S7S_13460 [Isoalcanivorax pacificus W11-5]|uniref:Uncharacterized protein n=1 Tax=Isoalcanivorax pacificus W11-5 TaxID=391936 RepID=A0A0B4XLF5_9GAMM|nr:hypothetical protein [Isoalcanivorax pacificus]AJD49104.1 hypothetical protein S7S_13460 [Isoalcanivorax pacificus W11-5]
MISNTILSWPFATLVTALVMASIVLRLLRIRQLHVGLPLVVILVLVALLPMPWGLGMWVRSYLGEFSISMGLLAVMFMQHRLGSPWYLPTSELRALNVLIVATAAWFYPMSLGLTYLDPYGLGFGDFRFSTALLLVGLAAWVMRAYGICLMLVAAQCAFALRLLPSDNLWDYLLDPWLTAWSLGWLVRDYRLTRKARRTPVAAAA